MTKIKNIIDRKIDTETIQQTDIIDRFGVIIREKNFVDEQGNLVRKEIWEIKCDVNQNEETNPESCKLTHWKEFQYDGENRVIYAKEIDGKKWLEDGSGQVDRIVEQHITYFDDGRVRTEYIVCGDIEKVEVHDGKGRLIELQRFDGITTYYNYDEEKMISYNTNLNSVTDWVKNEIAEEFDIENKED